MKKISNIIWEITLSTESKRYTYAFIPFIIFIGFMIFREYLKKKMRGKAANLQGFQKCKIIIIIYL
jgi:hypothetical protein